MNIYIGSDHAGYEFKINLVSYIIEKFTDHEIFDCGTYTEEMVNYPDYAEKVCDNVLKNENSLGILICGTGIGMSIAANKINGIRAALCSDSFTSKFSRKHNNSNVLVLGSRVVGFGIATDIVENFLNNKFDGERHSDRLDLIKKLEQKN